MLELQEDKTTQKLPPYGYIITYRFKYEFRNMPYLVADKFGNFYILPHFNKTRTTEFKRLDSSKGYIYYNRNMIRLSTLRKRVILKTNTYVQAEKKE
jgi:hypothetical protein